MFHAALYERGFHIQKECQMGYFHRNLDEMPADQLWMHVSEDEMREKTYGKAFILCLISRQEKGIARKSVFSRKC